MLSPLLILVLLVPVIIIILWLVNLFVKSRAAKNAVSPSAAQNPTAQAVNRLGAFFGSLVLAIIYFFVITFSWGLGFNASSITHKGGWAGVELFLFVGTLLSIAMLFVFLFAFGSKKGKEVVIVAFVASIIIFTYLGYAGYFNANG